MSELAFVVQRYGPEVTGGSESLARALAERLCSDFRVTVFTTCARDYVTWRNELPAGREQSGGVQVLRFPVDEERDLDSFNRFSEDLYGRPHSEEEERLWLRRQGPYAPALVQELARSAERFQAVVFFTYLYYPTCEGLKAAPRRSILVPTAHDEKPLRLAIYQEVFRIPRGFAFLTAAERDLVRSRFELAGRPAVVAGMGVEETPPPDVTGFRARYEARGPYVLYAGRIDAGKGCAEMIEFFSRFARQDASPPGLLLIGELAMPLPPVPGLRYLGHLAEPEKQAALAGADVVLCPSLHESLSIALLEGFARGVPALANARSAVLKEHCIRSNGGLYYEDEEEFVAALELLLGDGPLRRAMGENGRRYVRENYGWEAVLARYRGLIDAVS